MTRLDLQVNLVSYLLKQCYNIPSSQAIMHSYKHYSGSRDRVREVVYIMVLPTTRIDSVLLVGVYYAFVINTMTFRYTIVTLRCFWAPTVVNM